MIFLPEKSIRQNIRKFGFQSCEQEVTDQLNNFLQNFVQNDLRKVQKGGRIVLPSEYFGTASGSYADSVKFTDASVTDTLVRPAVLTQDLTGAIKGGAQQSRFNLSKSAFQKALCQVKEDLQLQEKIPKRLAEKVRSQAEEQFTKLFAKVQKQNRNADQLTKAMVQKVADQQNYRQFRTK